MTTTPRCGSRHRIVGPLLAASILLAAASPALAIIGGPGVDPNTAASPWSPVGVVNAGSGSFSGTLIAPGHVLTAAHVVAGVSPSNVTFSLFAGSSTTLNANSIYVHPDYAGFIPGADGTVHNDLAIIRLSGIASAGFAPVELYLKPLTAGSSVVTLVGYGGTCCTRRSGENRVDIVLPHTATGRPGVFVFDYDGPDVSSNQIGPDTLANGTLGANREATLQGGDSGSGAFIFDSDGKWKLAGVNTFVAAFNGGPTTPGAFGTGGGGQIVAGYSQWVDSIITTPVPESNVWALLLAGFILVMSRAKRVNSVTGAS